MKKLKSQILELLKEEEIQEKLKEILLRDESINNLKISIEDEEEKKKLRKERDTLQKEKEKLVEENKSLRGEKEELKRVIAKMKEAIKNICGYSKEKQNEEKENSNILLRQEKEKFQVLIREEQDKYNKLDKKYEELGIELSNSQKNEKELNRKITVLSETVIFYRDKFESFIEIQKKYNELSKGTRESLSGIFKEESVIGIVACGIQESNINSLWDYIKDKVKEERTEEDTENLKIIFEKLFAIYKLSNPKYEIQNVEKNMEFNSEEYTRVSSGKVSGKIEKVLFHGYINSNNGNVIKKSVVKVY